MCGVYVYKDNKSKNDCDDDIWILFVDEFTWYIVNGIDKTYY